MGSNSVNSATPSRDSPKATRLSIRRILPSWSVPVNWILVRVVEMTDRDDGTKVHTSVTARDPAALLPLQEALGYDLAQSLFVQQRNLVLEGLTDLWYFEATAHLMRDADIADLNQKIAMLPARTAGKVVYYATILHANNLKVAALLDSDNAGDQAAKQKTLIHTLGNRKILRTGDVCPGEISKPEIEDLLRHTLLDVARSQLAWDVTEVAAKQPGRRLSTYSRRDGRFLQVPTRQGLPSLDARALCRRPHRRRTYCGGELINQVNRALS